LRIHTDVRTPYSFASSVEALAKCESPSADESYQRLKPFFAAHVEYLRLVDGIVFVADSQVERSDANAERLDRLKYDLDAVGRTLPAPPLVFQCNKRDLKNSVPLVQMADELRWPTCAHVPTIALKGDGVLDALRALLAMVSPTG